MLFTNLKGAILRLLMYVLGLSLAAFALLGGATSALAETTPQPGIRGGYDFAELAESDYNHLLFEPEESREGQEDVEDEDDGDSKKRKKWVPWAIGSAASIGFLGTAYGIYRKVNNARKLANGGRKAMKGARGAKRWFDRRKRRRDGQSDFDSSGNNHG